MTEAFLQYVWQHQLLEKPLATVDGLSVVVERPGMLNKDAGPDFFDARILIDGIRWAGNVEVHINASDWKQHRHSADPNYGNVILHAVYCPDTDIFRGDGHVIPMIDLSKHIPSSVWDNYESLMHPAADVDIPCAPRIGEIPDFLFQAGQERLAAERLERKSADARQLLEACKGSWEQACYWLVARYFGGKTNAFPFELLAKKTPLTLLAKIKDNPMRVESLFFGQAGLLEQPLSDGYPLAMQREYNYLRASYNLNPMAGHLWKFFKLYPASFPTLRISQFASLMSRSGDLFSRLLETNDIKTLRGFFRTTASDYWTTHYLFDEEGTRRVKTLGVSVADRILINAWVPLLFAYGAFHDMQQYKDQAIALLQQLPPERNSIVGKWTALDVKPANAAQSQALIQRYNEYCSRHRCTDCSLAFRLLKMPRP